MRRNDGIPLALRRPERPSKPRQARRAAVAMAASGLRPIALALFGGDAGRLLSVDADESKRRNSILGMPSD